MKELLKIENFNGGMIDSAGEGKQPGNTFADSKNLVPTKTGSLETIHGFSTTGGLATLPTAFPKHSGTGLLEVTSILAEVFPFSSELPTAYDGRIYFVRDTLSANHVMLDKWFKGSTSLVTANDGFVFLDERKEATAAAGDWTTPTANTIVVTNASATYGLSTSNDYYNSPPWMLSQTDGPSTRYILVTDYSYDSGTDTATFTTWNTVGAAVSFTFTDGDSIVLRRWFHRGKFNPNFETIPGQCYESGGRVRGCGGPVSTATHVPWISQYINRTFFTGHAKALTYQGTYVDEMECRGQSNTITAPTEIPVIHGANATAPGGLTVLDLGTYRLYYTLEFDGYEEGVLVDPGSATITVDGTTEVIIFSLYWQLATASKRVTAINLYASQTVDGVTSEAYFIRRYDLVAPTANQLDATYGWIFETGTLNPGFAIIYTSGSVNNAAYQVRLDGDDWTAKGATYLERTGRTEDAGDRLYVSWQVTENVAGRQFFGDFYDPNTALNEKDGLKWTGFDSNSAPTLDVISSDPLFAGTSLSPGDPTSIKGLIEQNGWLHVFKDSSIYGISIGPDSSTWVRYTISKRDGLYSARSLGKLPDGNGIFFGDVDHFKMVHNQRITPLTHTLANTYYNLTNKSTVRAWFDKIDRAVCFSDGNSSTHYRGYLDMAYRLPDGKEAFPWYKIVMSAHTTNFVSTERDGSIIFVYSGVLYKWHKTDYQFGSQQIITYLKSNEMIGPQGEVLLESLTFWKPQPCDLGTLDNRVTIDGTAYNWSAQDKTKKYLKQFLAVTSKRTGRRFFVEYNTNAGGEYITSAKSQLGGIYAFGEVLVPVEASA